LLFRQSSTSFAIYIIFFFTISHLMSQNTQVDNKKIKALVVNQLIIQTIFPFFCIHFYLIKTHCVFIFLEAIERNSLSSGSLLFQSLFVFFSLGSVPMCEMKNDVFFRSNIIFLFFFFFVKKTLFLVTPRRWHCRDINSAVPVLPFFFVLVHRNTSRSEGDNHKKTTDYRKSLEEIVFKEVPKWFVVWNHPPGIVIKVECAEKQDK